MADIEMSNEEIINEFDNLFGSDDDQTTTVDDTETETQEDDTEDDSSSDESEDTTEDSTEDTEDQEQPKESPEDKKRKQQNFAFAEMRNELKTKDSFIEDLAKSIGLDKNLSTDEKQAKIKEAMLEKQAKETGVPLETLQRLEVLEARDREYQFSKRQQQTQDAIAGLVEKYSLDSDAVNGFVQQLVENGKNPLEADGVDLETEYLKLNFQSIMQAQIDAAVQAERDRSKKATDKSASGVDTGHGDGETEKKINSVKDLDNLFNGMDL